MVKTLNFHSQSESMVLCFYSTIDLKSYWRKKINNFHLNILHNFLIYLLWQLWLWCIAVGKFTTVWRIIMSLRRVCTKYFLNLILAMFLLAKLNLIFLKLQCIGTLIFFRIPCKGHNDNPDNALPIYGTKKPLWIDT